MHIMDRLTEAVSKKGNPSALGLDTCLEHLPVGYMAGDEGDFFERCAKAIYRYNVELIDALSDIVPAVKVQAAFYEMYGIPGMRAFKDTIDYASDAGLIVIADAKRGDIGSSAQAYASAFIGETCSENYCSRAFAADILTVNPYFGTDGMQPFVDQSAKYSRGIFALVKTSNPSGAEFQDLICDEEPLYMHVARKVMEWGGADIGECGYSSVGAVVGATYPSQGAQLRKLMKSVYFLVPGYGAQGAGAEDLAGCFDEEGSGAIVNASRSIICAWKKSDKHFKDAARDEALRMKDDLRIAISGK